MLRTSSITEQVAVHLRDGLRRRLWADRMPGRGKLAEELGVNVKTVERALVKLEAEGFLESQGPGRRRRIVAAKQQEHTATLVRVILYERDDASNQYILELRRQLEAAGHDLSFASKTLLELKQNPQRVARMVRADTAKVWVIAGGARSVLEWFAKSKIPAFALFGQMSDLPIAGIGPDKRPVLREVIHQLIDLGHRRIVLLTRAERRKPAYGLTEKVVLEELKNRGIYSGAYNIPDWEETPQGLNKCLDNLFRVTPPSAILVSDTQLCLAVKNYLAAHRGLDLRNVAIVCTEYHQSFNWCIPAIPHFRWDNQAIVRRAVRWVKNVASGKDDRRQKLTAAEFIGGETLKRLEVIGE